MLLAGETFNQRKRLVLSHIQTDLGLLEILGKCLKTFPDDKASTYETIALVRESYNNNIQNLVELKKWQIKEGVGEDEHHRLQIEKD